MSSSKHLKMTVTYAPSTLRAMQESEDAAKKPERSASSGGAGPSHAGSLLRPGTWADPAARHVSANDGPAAADAAARPALSASALALLHSGGLLTAYIPDVEGSSCGSYYTRTVQLWFAPEQAALYWSEPGAKICRPSRAIPVSHLRGLLVGKHSDVLSWSAISADPARCFSLVWSMHSAAGSADESTAELSLEAPTETERNDWLSALDHVISASGRTVIEQPLEAELDSPVPSPSARVPSALSCSPAVAAVPRKTVRSPSRHSLESLLGSAVDLTSALRRERRFIVSDRDPLSPLKPADQTVSAEVPASESPAYAGADQLSSSAPSMQTLQQFQQWMDVNSSAGAGGVTSLSNSAPLLTTPTPAAAAAVPSDSSDSAPTGGPPGRLSRQRTRASIFIDSRSAAAIAASVPPPSPSASRGGAVPPKSPSPKPCVGGGGASAAPSPLSPKDDPKSLEGSLNRLAQGLPFSYCAPPFENDDGLMANAAATAAAAAAASSAAAATAAAVAAEDDLPGQVPSSSAADSGAVAAVPAAAATAAHTRRPSLSDAHRSILLFYAPQSRRASGRAGGSFGQLSWCDSQTWTRRSGWKLTLQMDSVILLGKRTRNLQREAFAHLPEGECFSIVHDDGGYSGGLAGGSGGGGVDLHAEGGWPAIRAWLTDVDRVLRSCGFAMVRAPNTLGQPSSPTHRDGSGTASAGSSGSGVHSLPLRSAPLASSCSKLFFVAQSELKPKAWNAAVSAAAAAMVAAPASVTSTLHSHSGHSGSSPSISHKPPLSLAPSVSVASSAPSSTGSGCSFASSAAGSGANTPSMASSTANTGSAAFSLSLPAAAAAATASSNSAHPSLHIHSRGDSGATVLTPSPRSGRGLRSQLAPLDRHLSVSTSALSATRASSTSPPPPQSPGATLSSLPALVGGAGFGAAVFDAAPAPASSVASPKQHQHGRLPSLTGVPPLRAHRASDRRSRDAEALPMAMTSAELMVAAAPNARSSSPLPSAVPLTNWQCSGPL